MSRPLLYESKYKKKKPKAEPIDEGFVPLPDAKLRYAGHPQFKKIWDTIYRVTKLDNRPFDPKFDTDTSKGRVPISALKKIDGLLGRAQAMQKPKVYTPAPTRDIAADPGRAEEMADVQARGGLPGFGPTKGKPEPSVFRQFAQGVEGVFNTIQSLKEADPLTPDFGGTGLAAGLVNFPAEILDNLREANKVDFHTANNDEQQVAVARMLIAFEDLGFGSGVAFRLLPISQIKKVIAEKALVNGNKLIKSSAAKFLQTPDSVIAATLKKADDLEASAKAAAPGVKRVTPLGDEIRYYDEGGGVATEPRPTQVDEFAFEGPKVSTAPKATTAQQPSSTLGGSTKVDDAARARDYVRIIIANTKQRGATGSYSYPAKDLGLDTVYHETSVGSLRVGSYGHSGSYWSNDADLALGQGQNKGVLLEFAPKADQPFSVKIHKPGLELLAQEGKYELTVGATGTGRMSGDLKSVTIKKGAAASKEDMAVIKGQFRNWTKTTLPDGSTKYENPALTRVDKQPLEAPIKGTQASTPTEPPLKAQKPLSEAPVAEKQGATGLARRFVDKEAVDAGKKPRPTTPYSSEGMLEKAKSQVDSGEKNVDEVLGRITRGEKFDPDDVGVAGYAKGLKKSEKNRVLEMPDSPEKSAMLNILDQQGLLLNQLWGQIKL